MEEISTVTTTEQVPPNPFAEGVWKTQPTVTPVAEIKETIVEKEKEISEEKPPSNTPNQPEKPASVTLETVQSKPESADLKTSQAEPLKFANEESEKVYNLLHEGKLDDVYSIISEQKKLSSVDKLPPADIIKLNLQYQNKDFTPQEINELFEETYTYPEKPVQATMEDDDEFKAREGKYTAQLERLENRIKRDAKPATAELLKLSKEIVLPDIKQSQPALQQEPTQEELDAQKVQAEKFLQSVDEGLKVLNGYQATFKDEEVTIPVAYKLTKEEKDQIRPLIELSNSNAGEFLSKIGWIDDKGNINAAKLAEDLPFILNKQNVIEKLVSETGNKRHEQSIKSIKNIDYGGKKAGSGDMGLPPEVLQNQMATHFFSR